MTSDWKECTLEQISTILGDGLHGTPKYSINGKYAFINGNNLSNGKIIIKSDTKRVDKCEYEKYKKDLNNRTLLVSINGTLGNIAEYNEEKIILGKSACYFNVKENIDKYFIKYILLSKTFQDYLNNQATGTTIKNISLKQMREYNFLLPPLETQQKIAKVLSAIDDKIELNNSINNNLEQQAQAIFKFWFIDNEYEIEKETTIGEICKCELGGTPSRNKKEYWKGSIAWINSGAVNNYRITKATEYITELGLSKSATKLLPKKPTVLAITGATLGQISLLEIDSCTNQSVVGILENEQVPYEFIYPYICHNIHELLSHQTGGAQQHINKQNIEQLAISFPKLDIMRKYKNLVNPIYSEITNNCFENETLTQLRDTLLLKLMNGEIDVSKVDIDDILENQSADKLLFS